jgi:serine/threonine-protein kinase RsbW
VPPHSEEGDRHVHETIADDQDNGSLEASPPPEDRVTLRIPAESAYLAVVRTTTVGLASRIELTLDEIDDLRIAVGEACAILLDRALPDSELTCEFQLDPSCIQLTVRVPTKDGRLPAQGTFAWAMLSELAGEVAAARDSGTIGIVLRKRRSNHSASAVDEAQL